MCSAIAFGQTTEIQRGNVVYSSTKVNSSTVINSSEANQVSVSGLSTENGTGSVTVKVTSDVHKTTTTNYNLTVSSFSGISGIVLEGWSENNGNYSFMTTTSSEEGDEDVYDLEDDGETYTQNWAKCDAYLEGSRSDILSASDIKNNSAYANATFYGWGESYTYDEWSNWGYEGDYHYYLTKIQSGGRGKYVYAFYTITMIKYAYVNTVEEYKVSNFNYTAIPTGLPWEGVTSVTIGSTITSIADGAFANATSLQTITNNSSKFSVDSNGFLYTTDCAKLVAVPGSATGSYSSRKEYELSDNATSIASNALANVTYVTLYTNSITETDGIVLGNDNTNKLVFTGATQGTDNNHHLISNIISYTDDALGQVPSGTITKASLKVLINQLANSTNVCFIDLTGSNLSFKETDLGEITGLPGNCLLYLPSGITATGSNVVVGNTCENLVIYDKKNFFAPYAFKVTGTVTYSGRSFTKGQFATIVMPFSTTATSKIVVNGSEYSMTSKGTEVPFRIAYVYDYTSDKIVKFQYTGAFTANMPYILNANEAFTGFEVSGGVNVEATPCYTGNVKPSVINSSNSLDRSDATGCTFAGTYVSGQTMDSYTGGAIYGFATNGDFVKAGKVAVLPPFRGMFFLSDSEFSSAKPTFRIFEDAMEEDTEFNAETTGIDSAKGESQLAVVAEAGKLTVSAADANVRIASVSGAVVYSGKVNGSKSFDLNAGVYVVNGKKYIVK